MSIYDFLTLVFGDNVQAIRPVSDEHENGDLRAWNYAFRIDGAIPVEFYANHPRDIYKMAWSYYRDEYQYN